MALFTDEDILRLDQTYAQENVPFHARPLAAAFDILGDQFILDLMQNPAVEEINLAYTRLVPEVEASWPGAGVGLIASIDQVRKVVLGLTYGHASRSLDQLLGFKSHDQWAQWCRGDINIAARSCYSFADISDFITGINYMQGAGHGAPLKLWTLAAANLEEISNSLSTSINVASATQPLCLVAELAMKGTLYHLGLSEKEIRTLGHHHKNIALRLAKECPHRDDNFIADIVNHIPDYVITRYNGSSLTRLETVQLALNVQFIAASSLRRISGVDHASDFETREGFPGSRAEFFK
ncbi:hypothetical protein [Pseudomonas thivervalensis]|uniref:hypothetical protein n=1 Tax=Pseudomonas thivervalensis TaxID=86265 RepID=UPI003D6A846A